MLTASILILDLLCHRLFDPIKQLVSALRIRINLQDRAVVKDDLRAPKRSGPNRINISKAAFLHAAANPGSQPLPAPSHGRRPDRDG